MRLEYLIPLIFIPVFTLFWCGVVFFIGVMSGWRALGERYAIKKEEFTGPLWSMRSGYMRFGSRYNGVLTIGANGRGVFLSVFAMFRPGHSPLFIPWEHIELRPRRLWFMDAIDLAFTAVPGVHLSISRKLAEEVARAGGRSLPVFA